MSDLETDVRWHQDRVTSSTPLDDPPNTQVHIWCAIRRHCAVVKSAQHLGTLGNNPKDN